MIGIKKIDVIDLSVDDDDDDDGSNNIEKESIQEMKKLSLHLPSIFQQNAAKLPISLITTQSSINRTDFLLNTNYEIKVFMFFVFQNGGGLSQQILFFFKVEFKCN
jgi:hypothetical protein